MAIAIAISIPLRGLESWPFRHLAAFPAPLYAPETKSLTEVAGLSGCAGVKFRRQEVLCVERRGLGDEGRGAVCKGALRGPDRGDQQARGGASVWHRPSDGGEDAVILGAAGIPAQPAAGASEAGSIRGDHRADPGRG